MTVIEEHLQSVYISEKYDIFFYPAIFYVLRCSWEPSWITKEAPEPDLVQGFSKSFLAATK